MSLNKENFESWKAIITMQFRKDYTSNALQNLSSSVELIKKEQHNAVETS